MNTNPPSEAWKSSEKPFYVFAPSCTIHMDVATLNSISETDTELARSYDMDIAEWYVPMDVVTREVDYPDVTVQVGVDRNVCVFATSIDRVLCVCRVWGGGVPACYVCSCACLLDRERGRQVEARDTEKHSCPVRDLRETRSLHDLCLLFFSSASSLPGLTCLSFKAAC